MKKNKNIFCWICLVMAAIMLYTRYFTPTTELDKVYLSISSMLWILFGYVITIYERIKRLEKVVGGKK